MGLGLGAGIAIAGALSAAGSVAGGMASKPGDVEYAPPALGWRARSQWQGPLSGQLGNLAMGRGGFDEGYMGRAFQQAQSMLQPAMRTAQKSLNFAQMSRGIHDSGVAQQQQAMLQGGFMSSLSRSAMDIVLQNEVQRRTEMMQAMQMMLGGISVGGTYQTQGGMTGAGVAGQGVLGGAGDAMALYTMGNMFQGGNAATPQTSGIPTQNVAPYQSPNYYQPSSNAPWGQ